MKQKPKPRGFAAMDPVRVQEIATMGGMTVSRDRRHMAMIGRIGGTNTAANVAAMSRAVKRANRKGK